MNLTGSSPLGYIMDFAVDELQYDGIGGFAAGSALEAMAQLLTMRKRRSSYETYQMLREKGNVENSEVDFVDQAVNEVDTFAQRSNAAYAVADALRVMHGVNVTSLNGESAKSLGKVVGKFVRRVDAAQNNYYDYIGDKTNEVNQGHIKDFVEEVKNIDSHTANAFEAYFALHADGLMERGLQAIDRTLEIFGEIDTNYDNIREYVVALQEKFLGKTTQTGNIDDFRTTATFIEAVSDIDPSDFQDPESFAEAKLALQAAVTSALLVDTRTASTPPNDVPNIEKAGKTLVSSELFEYFMSRPKTAHVMDSLIEGAFRRVADTHSLTIDNDLKLIGGQYHTSVLGLGIDLENIKSYATFNYPYGTSKSVWEEVEQDGGYISYPGKKSPSVVRVTPQGVLVMSKKDEKEFRDNGIHAEDIVIHTSKGAMPYLEYVAARQTFSQPYFQHIVNKIPKGYYLPTEITSTLPDPKQAVEQAIPELVESIEVAFIPRLRKKNTVFRPRVGTDPVVMNIPYFDGIYEARKGKSPEAKQILTDEEKRLKKLEEQGVQEQAEPEQAPPESPPEEPTDGGIQTPSEQPEEPEEDEETVEPVNDDEAFADLELTEKDRLSVANLQNGGSLIQDITRFAVRKVEESVRRLGEVTGITTGERSGGSGLDVLEAKIPDGSRVPRVLADILPNTLVRAISTLVDQPDVRRIDFRHANPARQPSPPDFFVADEVIDPGIIAHFGKDLPADRESIERFYEENTGYPMAGGADYIGLYNIIEGTDDRFFEQLEHITERSRDNIELSVRRRATERGRDLYPISHAWWKRDLFASYDLLAWYTLTGFHVPTTVFSDFMERFSASITSSGEGDITLESDPDIDYQLAPTDHSRTQAAIGYVQSYLLVNNLFLAPEHTSKFLEDVAKTRGKAGAVAMAKYNAVPMPSRDEFHRRFKEESSRIDNLHSHLEGVDRGDFSTIRTIVDLIDYDSFLVSDSYDTEDTVAMLRDFNYNRIKKLRIYDIMADLAAMASRVVDDEGILVEDNLRELLGYTANNVEFTRATRRFSSLGTFGFLLGSKALRVSEEQIRGQNPPEVSQTELMKAMVLTLLMSYNPQNNPYRGRWRTNEVSTFTEGLSWGDLDVHDDQTEEEQEAILARRMQEYANRLEPVGRGRSAPTGNLPMARFRDNDGNLDVDSLIVQQLKPYFRKIDESTISLFSQNTPTSRVRRDAFIEERLSPRGSELATSLERDPDHDTLIYIERIRQFSPLTDSLIQDGISTRHAALWLLYKGEDLPGYIRERLNTTLGWGENNRNSRNSEPQLGLRRQMYDLALQDLTTHEIRHAMLGFYDNFNVYLPVLPTQPIDTLEQGLRFFADAPRREGIAETTQRDVVTPYLERLRETHANDDAVLDTLIQDYSEFFKEGRDSEPKWFKAHVSVYALRYMLSKEGDNELVIQKLIEKISTDPFFARGGNMGEIFHYGGGTSQGMDIDYALDDDKVAISLYHHLSFFHSIVGGTSPFTGNWEQRILNDADVWQHFSSQEGREHTIRRTKLSPEDEEYLSPKNYLRYENGRTCGWRSHERKQSVTRRLAECTSQQHGSTKPRSAQV